MTLVLALLLDAAFGEPRQIWDRIPHPAVLMGRIIDHADRRFNQGHSRRLKGTATIFVLGLAACLLGNVIVWLPGFGILEILTGAILLAHRSLVDHVGAVADALATSTQDARDKVAMIVGRDTSELDPSDIARAAIESAAENFSDGVTAPAFWFLILGLPGILIYKIVNTADSMIGYKTARYGEFGWAAARLDDLMNWIPARLTGALICIASRTPAAWRTMARDAQYHRSPNAGWPEAAMAGGLGIALSGPRSYQGERTADPYVNVAGRKDLTGADISKAVSVLWTAWRLLLLLTLVLAILGAVL